MFFANVRIHVYISHIHVYETLYFTMSASTVNGGNGRESLDGTEGATSEGATDNNLLKAICLSIQSALKLVDQNIRYV